MTSTRSPASQRKRPSITQSLDILNNLDKEHSTAGKENRLPQNARSARHSYAGAPSRPSVFEISNSPERVQKLTSKSSPLAAIEPLIPRRSLRIERQTRVQDTPLRRSRRINRTGSKDLEDVAEGSERGQESEAGSDSESVDESEAASDEQSDEDESESGQQSQEGNGDESVDEREAPGGQQSNDDGIAPGDPFLEEFPTPTSPSVFLRSLRRPRRRPRRDYEGGDPAETTPSKRRKSDRSTQGASEFTPGAERRTSTVMVRVDLSKDHGPSTQVTDGPQPSGPSSAHASNNVEDAEAEESGDSADDDVEPVYQTPEPGHSDSSSSEGQEEPSSLDKQSRQRERPSESQHGERRPPSTHAGSPRVNRGPGRGRRGRNSRRSTSPSVQEAEEQGQEEEQEEKPEVDYPRCKDAMKFGRQESNWNVLIEEGRKMGQHPDPSMAEHFKDITDLISYLRQRYIDLDASPRPSSKYVQKCEKLLDDVFREGEQLLDDIYYLALRRSKTSLEKCGNLFTEFERRVVPAMIQLIFAIFDAYHTHDGLFSRAYNHLHCAMTLLLKFCKRMKSLNDARYVPGATRSAKLRDALQELIAASKSDSLRRPSPEPSNKSREDGNRAPNGKHAEDLILVETRRRWTDDETAALLDGLQEYQDPDRYVQILANFGHRLRERTIRELREKARELHDQYIPNIEDELRTREGREYWHWLLSVRE